MPERLTQKAFARQLRQNQTETEALLWRYLKNRKFVNYKFRRQHPIGDYFADFACLSAKVVIEIDGETHYERELYDQARDEYLAAQGFKTLRYNALFLAQNEEIVLEDIWQELQKRRL
jgi:very-short-patch-repair endonuclease